MIKRKVKETKKQFLNRKLLRKQQKHKYRRYKEAPQTEIIRMYDSNFNGLIIRVHYEQEDGRFIPYDYKIPASVSRKKNVSAIASYIAKQAAQSKNSLIVLKLVLRDRLVEEFASRRIEYGKSDNSKNEEVSKYKSKVHMDGANILNSYRFTVYHQKKK